MVYSGLSVWILVGISYFLACSSSDQVVCLLCLVIRSQQVFSVYKVPAFLTSVILISFSPSLSFCSVLDLSAGCGR